MSQAQRNYEKVLNIGVIILILWHMLMSQSKYYFGTYKAESIYAIVLFLGGITYLILCRFLWKGSFSRIKNYAAKFRSTNQFICAALCFWYLVSFLVNGKPYIKENVWQMFDAAVVCLLVFNLPFVLTKIKAKKVIEVLLHVTSLYEFLILAYALWHVFKLDFIRLPTGEIIGLGRQHTFQLGTHYCGTSGIMLSFILVSFYMIATQKAAVKILYTINLIPFTYALLLTNSRAGFIACVAAYFSAVFLTVWNYSKEKPAFFRWGFGIIFGAAAAGIIWLSRSWAFQLFESITHYSNPEAAQMRNLFFSPQQACGYNGISRSLLVLSLPAFLSGEKIKKIISKVNRSFCRTAKIALFTAVIMIFCAVFTFISPLYHSSGQNTPVNTAYAQDTNDQNIHVQAGKDSLRDLSNLDTMKYRMDVWKSAISVMRSDWRTFLFGVTPVGVPDALINIGNLYFRAWHAHNQVLQIGVSLGVPMMILFVIFLVITGIRAVRLCLTDGSRHFRGAYIIPVAFAAYVVLDLVESYLFATFDIMSSLFFLFCGWINVLEQNKKEASED